MTKYEVIRPTDAEVLVRTDNMDEAQEEALNYAVVDGESIIVRKTKGFKIVLVAHSDGSIMY